MTRKDYVALAAELRKVPSINAWEVWKGCIDAIAVVCEKDNPRFKRAEFYKACGIGKV